jgi:hypothetical protein
VFVARSNAAEVADLILRVTGNIPPFLDIGRQIRIGVSHVTLLVRVARLERLEV